ncbi:MAG: UDP-diphosphatase [Candidatus Kerfeldbacteria bacterium CG_4_10_14_0_8_um_filter_42_10]|uniref:Undecaprenyl-diphosphatase n=1 Tax=Candidatus Kerfeldbacteria bacterium CG_4_10_14_0_8_um_filter_42_10 TaxID=2014248 RepID=A0A2M7RKH2_9BACT|nr:MAG: UDP-diphosphatase [Candidatus Kerfeldbacteria bacterium CG_4_10_14_0_8_um_filter_42_10]
MELIQSIILGLAQGLGEFLPISSSGHLVVLPWLFNFKDPGLAFDVALHWGTLIAVLAYFWKDWIRLVKSLFRRGQNDSLKQDRKMLGLIVIASVPGALFGYLLDDWAETSFRAPLLIAGTLAIMGLILGWADKAGKKGRSFSEIGLWDSLIIGISQAVAIVPGVSRSGATISMALFRNINREAAARFSFLLSTPIIFGAGLVKVPELLHEGISVGVVMGALVAAFSGFLSIKYLLRYIQTKNYRPFVWYRIALALVILGVYFMR